MSPITKLVVASFEVKIIASVELFEVAPSLTVDEVIAMLGTTVSKVQLNCVATLLVLPELSVKPPPAISMVVAP